MLPVFFSVFNKHAAPCIPPTAQETFSSSFRIISCNKLSAYWKDPYIQKFGFTRCDQSKAYAGGMGGYFLALIWRVCGLVKDFVFMVGALSLVCRFGREELGKRAKAFGGSILEIGIATIGMLCPPLAYRADEWLQRDEDIRECSVTTNVWEQLMTDGVYQSADPTYH